MLKNNYNTINTPVKNPIRVQSKIIGYLEHDAFFKPVQGSKHQLRCPPAWAIDASAFDDQVKVLATRIVIVDRETNTKYHTSVETFDRLKRTLNRGFGKQYFLTLNYWQVEHNGNRQLSLWGRGGDNGGD